MSPAEQLRRAVRLGFEVRVDLRADEGSRFAAQLTRAEANVLALQAGDRVFAHTVQVVRASEAEPAPAI